MKKKNQSEYNCVKSFPQCIQWNLGDIPSLGISNGDYLDELVYAIVNKLCDCCGGIDLSTLSLQCIYDKIILNDQPVHNPTLVTILQLLIDNECTLKDLIDNLQIQINGIKNPTLVLDLKCLAKTDAYGNPLPYDTKSVLQDLITEVCLLKTDVTRLDSVVIDLQNQIDAINVVPYELPTITTCISPNKKLDISIKDVATSLCSLRNVTGTETQLQTAIGNQCSNFNTQFGSILGWNLSPVNLAQSYSNIELAICNILNRVIAIEQTCCAPSCDKIKIGFTYNFNYDTRELTLSFTSGAGTFIPSGFTDCGTEFKFKDCSGNLILTSIQPITNNADLIFTLPNGACVDNLTVDIDTKFCLIDETGNILITCRDCVNKLIQIQSECCILTNPNEEDVILTYQVTV